MPGSRRRSASQEVVTRGFIGTSLLRRDSQDEVIGMVKLDKAHGTF
jgi:hypothetical protein